MKRLFTFLFIFLLVLSLFSCSNISKDTKAEIEFTELNINRGKLDGLFTQTANGIVFQSLGDNYCSFYLYNFENESVTELGKLENFGYSVNNVAEIDNHLYFYVSIKASEKSNNFYDINLIDNTLTKLYTENFSRKYNPICLNNNKIYISKSHLDSRTNSGFTRVDEYLPQTKEQNTKLSTEFNHQTKTGDIISKLDFSHNNFFTYSLKYENGLTHKYLDVYDEDFSKQKSISIDHINKILFDSAIGAFEIFDDYFYINNWSNYGYIGKIKENKIKTIQDITLDLDIAQNSEVNIITTLFFQRGTNKIFYINKKTDKLALVNFTPLEDKYTVSYITQYGTKAVIYYSNVDDINDYKYIYLDIEALVN